MPKTTLLRHFKSLKESGLTSFEHKQNSDVKRMFKDAEEQLLVEYIIKASELQCGLTLKHVRTLAYQFDRENKKACHPSWENSKLALKDCLIKFRKRHEKELALRKPEVTSLVRSIAFNKENFAIAFQNYKNTFEKNPGITPFHIRNCDEKGFSTVYVPPKILASRGVKNR